MTNEDKQALIEHAKSWITDAEAARDEIPFGFDEDTEKEVSLIKIALAALTATPDEWQQRAEEAEASLAELDKQEPVYQFICNRPEDDGYAEWADCNADYFSKEPSDMRRILFTRPAPAADLAELVPVPPEFLSAEQNSQGMFELSEDCMTRLAIALNQQAKGLVIKPGYALVPVEPTEEMIIEGFESRPDESFSEPAVWKKYSQLSGCQQAAYKAQLCWAAMIAAAPTPPE